MSASGSFWEKVMTWRLPAWAAASTQAGVFAVQIDAPHLRLGEDPQLGGEVVLKVGVARWGRCGPADVQKQAAAKWVHRVRWYFSAWLDTSMVR